MNIKNCVVVSDSFKGTMSSSEICNIVETSVPAFFPECTVSAIPVADGGEGTADCFVKAGQADRVPVTVSGPYGEKVETFYARRDSRAIIEMAAAAGLPLVGENRNPEKTTTYGVGEMIRHAAENGCTEILLGLGGSATNDGGTGCAAALGVKFYDENGESFVPCGATLGRIARIDAKPAAQLLDALKITVMCDVENPLWGETGAAYVFAPQKGADEAMCLRLDQGLRHMDEIMQRDLNKATAQIPGAGAAGGMGAGCIGFLNAGLRPGIEAILDMVHFDDYLDHADLVITGEGRIDSQSVHGKVISGVAKRTSARNIPLIAIVGSIDDSACEAYDLGVTAMFGIDREAVAFEKYAHKTAQQYKRTLEDILRLLKSFR